MLMDAILREKRKALGLTQEQVANYLGVTTPAVNKWEKGTTCPDIALLPALARLLKTDPNTLLNFEESLTQQEIGHFLKEVAEKIRVGGYEQGFALAMEKTREYPNCAGLLHSTAMMLDGAQILADLSEEEKSRYLQQITVLYERVAKSGDPALADKAKYMLASKRILRKQYVEAQEMLDLLPEWSALDKRGMQADIWAKQGKTAEAAELLERKLLMGLVENLTTLARLVKLVIAEGDEETALRLAKASQTECEAFGLWQYSAYLVPMQAAVARKDVSGSLAAISSMLEAVLTPWDMRTSPLFRSLPQQETPVNLGKTMLPPLLNDLEHNPDYDFLRGEPEFGRLMKTYREKYADVVIVH